MNFRIRGLEVRQFDHLFARIDGALAGCGPPRRGRQQLAVQPPRVILEGTASVS